MNNGPLNVLLVEDDPEYARFLRLMLARKPHRDRFAVTHVYRLGEALDTLAGGAMRFDVVLLDLTLPDVQGLETLRRAQAGAAHLPLIVLTGLDDETLAVNAVKQGAQDYLVKGQVDANLMARAIAYAIERKRAQVEQEWHINRLALLRDVDQELTHRLDVEYVLTMALDAAVRLSGAHVGLIGLIEDGQITMLQNIGYDPQALAASPLLEDSIVARCLRQRKAELVPDVAADPDYLALVSGTRAQIALPLISTGRVIGFLNVETPHPDRFNPETFEFLVLLAARIAAAVDNAQLYHRLQDQFAELRELYAQVSDLEQMKTDMIHLAAHDLRTPLSNVMGYVWLLRKTLWDGLGDQQREYIHRIQESIERMQTITNDILSLQRVESEQGLEKEDLNLRDLVEKAFREHQEPARQKNQHLHLNMKLVPVPVYGDPALLYEAIANLVGNAIKYTPEGGRVELRLKSGDGFALFEVEDNGYGVPEEQQARLFQPFFRAKSRETAEIKGTGLGLNLVKNIVERHDGEVVFESRQGQGSTFGFRLPLE